MATFSPKNFPADVGNNKLFSGAGERTTYVPTETNIANYKYVEGFKLAKGSNLYSEKGEIYKTLSPGSVVHFTKPATLVSSEELTLSKRGNYAPISLVGYDKPIDGYIMISNVIKPAGSSQNRIATGIKTQDAAAQNIMDLCYKKGIEISDDYTTAPPSSTRPDLLMEINNKKIQFEIKGTDSRNAAITFFDKSVKRTKVVPLLDDIAKIFIQNMNYDKNYPKSFVGIMDYYRNKDYTIGFVGDEGVIKSGKLPPELTTTNGTILRQMRKLILKHFDKSKDDYFIINDRSNNSFEVYYVGENQTNNILRAHNLPLFKSFSLATYGGASSGSTRVGLKIKL